MRSVKRILGLGFACCTALSAIGLATAGVQANPVGEIAYADSYGNLVVLSPSGYKRVVVGRADLAPVGVRGDGDVVYFDDTRYLTSQQRVPDTAYRCSGGAAVYHGRSYMYGLSRDEVAVLRNRCR